MYINNNPQTLIATRLPNTTTMTTTARLLHDFTTLPQANTKREADNQRYNLITKTLTNNPQANYLTQTWTDQENNTCHNIIALINNPPPTSTILDAHYDIANPHSQNIQDNTASIINLLILAQNPKFTGIITFTDNEEYVDPERSGIKQLLQLPYTGPITTLELTAIGNTIWQENNQYQHCPTINCPLNNATYARHYNRQATCIGLLPEQNINNPWPIWNICHDQDDNQYSIQDMENFQNNLLQLYNN